MTILATLLGLYGLNQFLRRFEHAGRAEEETAAKPPETLPGYLARRAVGRRAAPSRGVKPRR